ncbi:MAG: hypothetical protein HYV09_06215 [Deltaproteobacteria bacterium]|nr:hypothetical protein [Deltaproteobacteria bacterium]
MRRGVIAFVLLLGCARGDAVDSAETPDASLDGSQDKPACDPAADPCPPDQHCSPILRQCILGCQSDAGCSKGRCDVENHACVGCLANADCRPEEVCVGTVCVPGCTPGRPCPEGLLCCAGGCVDPTTNVDHCGACGKKCTVANGSAACAAGKCAIASCKTPWESCDGNVANGCESDTTSSTTHCGGCGKACRPSHATGSCALGVCKVGSCAAGFGDCNVNPADGCEADLGADPSNCGGCGNKPTEACNLRDDDCNGRCDDVDGCRKGIHRSTGAEHFYTDSSVEAACCGFTVENLNYFYLYAAPAPDTAPFHRCFHPTAKRHFYSTSATCEAWGASTLESVIGYIGTKETCGSVPLYRLYGATSNDHLYTTDPAERSAAIAAGWKDEGTAGWVWRSPRG